MAHATQMSAGDTGLLVIDVQTKLQPKVLDADRLAANIAFLLDVAAVVGVPALATEQYPRGLGPTLPDLARRLPERPEKVRFSSCAVPSVVATLRLEGRPRVLLAGIETHVCVLHTALDLLAQDFRVYLAVDAVSARYRIDHDTALRRLEQAGAVLTTTEGCAFEWLGGADHPGFKEVSRLIQERMKTLPGAGS
jgi:nicotinamidase-related amidase